ncbi:MAG: hypothetical protein HUU55_14750 [Myxococcales bacterium]|nr:hypothetical protein [Myxococcales bacterium]
MWFVVIMFLGGLGLWKPTALSADTYLTFPRPRFVEASISMEVQDRYGTHVRAGMVTARIVPGKDVGSTTFEFLLVSEPSDGGEKTEKFVQYRGNKLVMAYRVLRLADSKVLCDKENPIVLKRELEGMGAFLSDWIEMLAPMAVGGKDDWNRWLKPTSQESEGCIKRYGFEPERNRITVVMCDSPNKGPRTVRLLLNEIPASSSSREKRFWLPVEATTTTRQLTSVSMLSYREVSSDNSKLVDPCPKIP